MQGRLKVVRVSSCLWSAFIISFNICQEGNPIVIYNYFFKEKVNANHLRFRPDEEISDFYLSICGFVLLFLAVQRQCESEADFKMNHIT